MGRPRPGDKIYSSVFLLLFSFNSFSFLFIFLLASYIDFKIKDKTDQKKMLNFQVWIAEI